MRLDDATIEKLYEKCNTPNHVILHCKGVSDAAVKIGNALNEVGFSLDIELIRVSGLIHDVMRTSENHGEAAADLLTEMGYREEADVIRNHMHYSFGAPKDLTEEDVVCLADRLVKEDTYVGIDRRVDYLIHKPGECPERTKRFLAAKKATKEYMKGLEEILGQSIDSLFMDSNEILDYKLSKALRRVEKPSRYTGGEKGTIIKEGRDCLKFAFAFPDLYEIGMSYMGLQILYRVINGRDNLCCERVFEPAPDMGEIMRAEDIPLFTLETKTPVNQMDVFGFTLQYEMSFTNILDMLNLAGIPLNSRQRQESDPLIIAGGPCAYNPEPLADFIDVFLIGDGEELLPEFLSAYKDAKNKGLSKGDFLKSICSMTGVYVPSFYNVLYNTDGTIKAYEKNTDEAPDNVKRAIVSDLNDAPFPTEIIVPFIETVHDRSVVETFRGCTRGCRFCQAGMIYRPVRERRKENIKSITEKQLNYTGNEELSLLSLSSSDYSEFEEMATEIMNMCAEKNVALSLPSLRLDSFSFKVLNEIQKYRKSGLTFAPEAGTQRLRDVINKGIKEDDIYEACSKAMDLGWTHIKLYFMIGLPTETFEDLDGIAEIAKRIIDLSHEKGGRRFNVTVSVSNFVPKAHTPFQWVRQNSAGEFREKHNYLREKLRIKGVTFHYHDDDTSVLEAVIARGDRRVGILLLNAYEKGCKMDSWTEFFNRETWDQAMKDSEIDPLFYADRERSIDEVLPWDIIDSAISKQFLISEYNKSLKELTTQDCRYGCVGCGINRITECKWGGIYGQI